MLFKRTFSIRDLPFDKEALEFNFGRAHNIIVTLHRSTEEEQKQGYQEMDSFCTVRSEWTPKDMHLSAFKSLAANKMPKGSKKTDEWSLYHIDEDGNISGNVYLPARFFPDRFATFLKQCNDELSDYALRTVNILRWRSATEGHHNPLAGGRGHWSFDGQNWFPMPGISHKAYMWPSPYIHSSDEILEDVKQYVKAGYKQPLGHELYLEAWDQRHQNPRSALVIGIAAAETAIKQCIISLDPGKRASIENDQSPSIIRMLSEDIPLLPTKNKVNKKAFEPNSYMYEILEKGINMRNQIVHGRTTTITYETLEEILLAVHDVLYVLDYCSGYDWALGYVRPDIRKALEE